LVNKEQMDIKVLLVNKEQLVTKEQMEHKVLLVNKEP
jgi:hypothetical protein